MAPPCTVKDSITVRRAESRDWPARSYCASHSLTRSLKPLSGLTWEMKFWPENGGVLMRMSQSPTWIVRVLVIVTQALWPPA